MQEHVEPFLRGGPLAGVAMTAVGIGGYCWHTAARFFDGAHTLAQAAAPTAGQWSWDSVAQAVTAILTIVGGVITWLSLQRNTIGRANRDSRVEDALADIRISLAKQKAEIELRHAENSRRLDRQDDDLAAIKQSVAPAPESTPTS
jgi:hypothetical protein